jgi:hypothetical protein
MSIYNFPDQRISEKQKDIEWHKSHILGYLSYASSSDFISRKKEINDLFYAYSAKLTPEGEKKVKAMITERCGQNFGPQYYVYPLIENQIEEIVSQYRRRPLKRKCLVNNEKAVIKKLDAKIDMVLEKLLRDTNKEMQPELGMVPESPNPEIEVKENIDEFFGKDFRTVSEEIAEDILYQVLLVKKEKEKIYEMLRFFCIAGRVHTYLDEKDGHPSFFVPHTLDCDYDQNPHEQVQKDLQYFTYDKYSTINEIFNTFDNITEKDKKIIQSYSSTPSQSSDISWFKNSENLFRIRVTSMMWVSRIKRRFKVITNKTTGKEEYKILKEDDKAKGNDTIKTLEIDDVRHITMVGPEVTLSWGSLDKQMQTIGNPKKRFLPVVGVIDDNNVGIGEVRSIAKKLVYLQDFASEILYELRMNARQVDGNVMVYDLSNIPKEWAALGPDRALEKVNFFLKRDRMQIINSKDKRSAPYASSVNVSQKGRSSELLQLLGLIEDLATKITGVKASQENPYQKATVAEISESRSSDRLEEIYGIFDTFVDTLQERIVLKGKHVYEENQVFSYFGGDNQQKFLEVMPEFFMDDMGVYIGDNRQEYERKKRVDTMADNAFANVGSQQAFRDLIKIHNADSSTEAESILDKGLEALEKMKQENNKLAQEQAQAAAQAEVKRQEEVDALDRERLQNNIDVAKIYANNKADESALKERGQNLRKMADIEKEMTIKNAEMNKTDNK